MVANIFLAFWIGVILGFSLAYILWKSTMATIKKELKK